MPSISERVAAYQRSLSSDAKKERQPARRAKVSPRGDETSLRTRQDTAGYPGRGEQGGEGSGRTSGACSNYRYDMVADTGVCKCGYPKSAHRSPAARNNAAAEGGALMSPAVSRHPTWLMRDESADADVRVTTKRHSLTSPSRHQKVDGQLGEQSPPPQQLKPTQLAPHKQLKAPAQSHFPRETRGSTGESVGGWAPHWQTRGRGAESVAKPRQTRGSQEDMGPVWRPPQGHGLQRNALYEERMARARGQQTPRSAEEADVADRHAEVSRAVAKAEAARNEHKARLMKLARTGMGSPWLTPKATPRPAETRVDADEDDPLMNPDYHSSKKEEPMPMTPKTARGTLAGAARSGNLSALKTLLGHGVAVDAKDDTGATPLLWASRRGSLPLVAELVKAGAEPNRADADGSTPLLAAAECGQLGVLQALIGASADPNLADRDGVTALLAAASRGHQRVVSWLVAAGADADAADTLGYTAATIGAAMGAFGHSHDDDGALIADDASRNDKGASSFSLSSAEADEAASEDPEEEAAAQASLSFSRHLSLPRRPLTAIPSPRPQAKAMLLALGYSEAQIAEAAARSYGDMQAAAERLLDTHPEAGAAVMPSLPGVADPPLVSRRSSAPLEEEEEAGQDEDEDTVQTRAMLLALGYSAVQIAEAVAVAYGDMQAAAERLLDAHPGGGAAVDAPADDYVEEAGAEEDDAAAARATLLAVGYTEAQIEEATASAHGDVQAAAERLLDALHSTGAQAQQNAPLVQAMRSASGEKATAAAAAALSSAVVNSAAEAAAVDEMMTRAAAANSRGDAHAASAQAEYATGRSAFLAAHQASGDVDAQMSAASIALKLGLTTAAAGEYTAVLRRPDLTPQLRAAAEAKLAAARSSSSAPPPQSVAVANTTLPISSRLAALEARLGCGGGAGRQPPLPRLLTLEAAAGIKCAVPSIAARLSALEDWTGASGL